MARSTKREEEAQEASMVMRKVSKSDIPADEAPLTPEQERELAEVTDRVAALGRRSTAQAYEYGEELAKAQAILPPKKFGKWLAANCGISTKAAKNYTRVYKELAGYQDRLEKAAVAPTAMFALLGAEDKAIEAVLDAFENGERPTAAKVKLMTGTAEKNKKSEMNVLDMPGRAGCLKVGEARLRANVDMFYKLLSNVFPHVEAAAEKFSTGQRVIKADLAAAVELDSRHACDLFQLTLAPFIEGYDAWTSWKPTSIEGSTAWSRVQRVLYTLGSEGNWPTREAFKAWIVDEVYPAMKFVIRGEAMETATGSVAPDEMAAEDGDEVTNEVDASAITRIQLEAPALQADNVVALAPRLTTKAVDAAEV
jgi:hypothetical protein